jgi:DNA-binding GntR family transcriptional regulator
VVGADQDDLAAIHELRRMVELPTIRKARDRATDADIERVWDALTAFESVTMQPQTAEYSHRHIAFIRRWWQPAAAAGRDVCWSAHSHGGAIRAPFRLAARDSRGNPACDGWTMTKWAKPAAGVRGSQLTCHR